MRRDGKRRGGWDGGRGGRDVRGGAGIDAATSVLVPFLALLCLAPLSLSRVLREGWERSEG